MRKKLPVPENIPLRWELFRGFGKPELLRTTLITGIVLAGCVVFCQFSDWKPRIIASVMEQLSKYFGSRNGLVPYHPNLWEPVSPQTYETLVLPALKEICGEPQEETECEFG